MPRDANVSNGPQTSPSVQHVKMVQRGEQCRCSCGSMMMRVIPEGLELKCRKCKSLVLITREELATMFRTLHEQPESLSSR